MKIGAIDATSKMLQLLSRRDFKGTFSQIAIYRFFKSLESCKGNLLAIIIILFLYAIKVLKHILAQLLTEKWKSTKSNQ